MSSRSTHCARASRAIPARSKARKSADRRVRRVNSPTGQIMNWELFAAFLVITTGASQGIRAGLTTVAGTTLGNAILLAAIAFGLGFVLKNAAVLFEVL